MSRDQWGVQMREGCRDQPRPNLPSQCSTLTVDRQFKVGHPLLEHGTIKMMVRGWWCAPPIPKKMSCRQFRMVRSQKLAITSGVLFFLATSKSPCLSANSTLISHVKPIKPYQATLRHPFGQCEIHGQGSVFKRSP